MRTIDLMADLELDDGDTKSDGFEFQTFFSFSDSLLGFCGAGVGFWILAPHPHVTFRGSPTSTTVNLPFNFFRFPDLSVILPTYYHESQVEYTFDT